jgi:hypothetical protein
MNNAPEDTYPVAKVLVRMVAVIALCLAAAWLLAPSAVTARVRPNQVRDLSDATFVEIRTLRGNVVMSGELRDHVDALGNVEKDAELMGEHFDRVIGEIEVEIPRAGETNRGQELEVDVISLEPTTTYQVFINDRPAVTFVTDDRGSVDVEFDLPPVVR